MEYFLHLSGREKNFVDNWGKILYKQDKIKNHTVSALAVLIIMLIKYYTDASHLWLFTMRKIKGM